jgi:hypothetical protein
MAEKTAEEIQREIKKQQDAAAEKNKEYLRRVGGSLPGQKNGPGGSTPSTPSTPKKP